MQCRICGYEGSAEGFEEDTRNHLGFWCPYCDSFSYTLDEHDQRRQFLLWLEDVKIGTPLTDKRIMKQNVSPLRYPGGKTKLAPYVAAKIPHGTNRLVEPFCGGASVSLACLMAGLVEKIRLNDMEPGVFSLFRTILTDPEQIISRLQNTKADRETYFAYRKSLFEEASLSDVERGFRYLYCNRLAFSGILLGNPTGDLKSRYNPKTLAARIRQIYSFRDQIEVTQNDALSVIEEEYWRGEETLLFIDPPYYKQGPKLYPKAFSLEDHQNLAFLVEDLYKNVPGANMIITYDNADAIQNLYALPKTEIIKPVYSCVTQKIRKEEEQMIINNKATRECDRRKLEPGDKIVCQGIEATIAEIKYQEYWEDEGFIVEFTDTNGVYRSWKQALDGRYVTAYTG